MKKAVFRNTPVSALMLLGIMAGGFIAYSGRSEASLIIGLCVVLYSTWAALILYLGVVVDSNVVWMPLPVLPFMPIIVIGRRRVSVGDIGYITYTGKSMGLESVSVDSNDVRHRILFVTREQRLAFFDAIKAVRPDVTIYRSSRA